MLHTKRHALHSIGSMHSFALRVLLVVCITVWPSQHDASAQEGDNHRWYISFQPAWLIHGIGLGSGLHPTFITTGEYQWADRSWPLRISASAGAAYVQANDTYAGGNICVYADLRIAAILDDSGTTVPFLGISIIKSPANTLHLDYETYISNESWSDVVAWCAGVRYRAGMHLCFDITLRRSYVATVYNWSSPRSPGNYIMISFGWLWRIA